MSRQSYHHGDLRAALVAEALRLLEKDSLQALSLREVARNVGVSATAVYRHFPSKDDLLQALAEHGLGLLDAQQRKAGMRARGNDAFAQTGRAYVRFALAHPNLFRLIFIHTPNMISPDGDIPEDSPFRFLEENIARILGPGAHTDEIFVQALRSWSLVHGLAMLMLDGQVDRKTVEGLIDRIVVPGPMPG